MIYAGNLPRKLVGQTSDAYAGLSVAKTPQHKPHRIWPMTITVALGAKKTTKMNPFKSAMAPIKTQRYPYLAAK